MFNIRRERKLHEPLEDFVVAVDKVAVQVHEQQGLESVSARGARLDQITPLHARFIRGLNKIENFNKTQRHG